MALALSRIVASAEGFPSRAYALRAAKACVRQVGGFDMGGVRFKLRADAKRPGYTLLTW